MQIDPVLEWQRLTAEYRQKSAEELLELARDYADLTEPAQQALRAEMRSRGLGDPENPKSVTALQSAPREPLDAPLALKNAPSDPVDDVAFGNPFAGLAPEPVPDTPDTPEEAAVPHEYTWKTILRACDEYKEAWRISEALRRAGIESWIERQGSKYAIPWVDEFMTGDLQVQVAADELEAARAVASQPIPQDIIEESETEIPEYKVPKCPKCGAEDPILEAVEPSNTWRCEQCDAQWTETAPAIAGESPKGWKKPS
jgi:ribosomal protein L37AE/L43A